MQRIHDKKNKKKEKYVLKREKEASKCLNMQEYLFLEPCEQNSISETNGVEQVFQKDEWPMIFTHVP